MTFTNLPIEVDENGKTKIRDGVSDPYGVDTKPIWEYDPSQPGASSAPPRLKEWSIDPVTRVAGALAVHTCLLYTSPSPRDLSTSRMPSSA